jgi:hypothetical protein
LSWTFNWDGTDLLLHEQDMMTLIINSPSYVNLQSVIDSLTLTFTDKTNVVNQWDITVSSNGAVSSTYGGQDGYLGRVNVIAITSVAKYDKTIHITFKNISNNGTVNPHMIEMSVAGSVINTINGGI